MNAYFTVITFASNFSHMCVLLRSQLMERALFVPWIASTGLRILYKHSYSLLFWNVIPVNKEFELTVLLCLKYFDENLTQHKNVAKRHACNAKWEKAGFFDRTYDFFCTKIVEYMHCHLISRMWLSRKRSKNEDLGNGIIC